MARVAAAITDDNLTLITFISDCLVVILKILKITVIIDCCNLKIWFLSNNAYFEESIHELVHVTNICVMNNSVFHKNCFLLLI